MPEVYATLNPYDEWLTIFANLEFEDKHRAMFSQIDWEKTYKIYKEGKITKRDPILTFKDTITDYPVNKKLIQKILNLENLTVGNPELGEQIIINHVEPIKYLKNLKELSICNSAVTTLKPIWSIPSLRRIWIENTYIPLK